MGETFYVVQQLINGGTGTLPSKFTSLEEAREFKNKLIRIANDPEYDDLEIEFHIYEVKELIV